MKDQKKTKFRIHKEKLIWLKLENYYLSHQIYLSIIYTRKLVLSKRGYSKLDILPFPKSHSQEVGFPFDKPWNLITKEPQAVVESKVVKSAVTCEDVLHVISMAKRIRKQ